MCLTRKIILKITHLIAVILALGLLAPLPQAAGAGLKADVDPRVWQDTTNGQAADFMVVLRNQANLAPLASSALQATPRVVEAYRSLRLAADASQPAVEAYLKRYGASYRAYWILNMLVVHGRQELVSLLAARPDVLYIEADTPFKVNLETPETIPQAPGLPAPTAAPQPGLVDVHAPDLWARGITGQGIVYANADTGVQWDHPALKGQYRGWDGAQADHNYNWWDAIHAIDNWATSNVCGFDLKVPCDDYGHGTHTTGTGVGGNTASGPIGMAPGARWIACRNMNGGIGRPSTYIECLQFLTAPTDLNGQNPEPSKHADVISNSYSCTLIGKPASEGCSSHSLQAAVDAVRSAGIFMSVSAGNDGSACSTITDPPGLEASVFTVGAVDAGNNNVIAGFSSRGPVIIDPTPLLKPNLVAPGVSVYSSLKGNLYGYESGTSMAAPHVAGAVALLWSAYRPLKNKIPETEALLENSAVPLYSNAGCGTDTSTSLPNNVYGYGLLDILKAYLTVMPLRLFNPIVMN